ncbi:DUF3263 domain-containing protein [Kitasatospora sp. NPDC056783]|uniref:DUF3263 domain-containing protein n=1 Tax=Kitasatospora sp. NPDC056783 TaxID=3345943 RepID=UPI003676E88C
MPISSASPSEPSGMAQLSDQESAVLAFEYRHWAAHPPVPSGVKESAIRQELGIAPTRYYQLLNRLLDAEPALAQYPVMVNRLRAVREGARAARQSSHGA